MGKPSGYARLQTVGGFQTVPHLALGRVHRGLPGDHAVGHRRQRVHIGVTAGELRRRILLRRGIARVQLAFQLTAAGAQRQRTVTGEAGRAVNGQHDVFRADAAVDQPRLVQLGDPLHDGLQNGASLGGGQRAAAQTKVMGQRHALFGFFHRIHGVVFLQHIQNLGQAGGGGDVPQVIVQVLEIHTAGLEQHFPALLGHQGSVQIAAVAEGDGKILLDEHKPLFLIENAPVAQAVPIGAEIAADGIPPGQLGSQRQRPLRVLVLQAAPAVGAVSVIAAGQRLQAVGAKGGERHR